MTLVAFGINLEWNEQILSKVDLQCSKVACYFFCREHIQVNLVTNIIKADMVLKL
jgi:hypothetical protein